MKKKTLLFLATITATAILFTGCGSKEDETTPVAEETIEETEQTNPTVEIVDDNETEVQVEMNDNETINAFMETDSFNFDIVPDESFILHTYNSKNEDVREKQDFETVLTNVNSFETKENYADVEGYHYEQGTFIIYKNEHKSGVNFNAYICDYYTGTIIEFAGEKEVSSSMKLAQAENAFIVKVGGTEYSITAFSDFEMVDYGWELTFTALIPDDYDGLCFCIGSIEINDEDETSDKEDGAVTLITDTDYSKSPETWHFYRFNSSDAVIGDNTQTKKYSNSNFGKELNEYLTSVSSDSANIKELQKKGQDMFRDLCSEYYAIYEEYADLYATFLVDQYAGQDEKLKEIETTLNDMKQYYDMAISDVNSERSMSLEEIGIVKMGMENRISYLEDLLQ